MESFWESSPEWRRKQELGEAFDEAERAKREAAEAVLACVRHDAVAPGGVVWERAREGYKEAYEAWNDAADAWVAANKAFRASAAGKARARYLADPLASPAEEIAA